MKIKIYNILVCLQGAVLVLYHNVYKFTTVLCYIIFKICSITMIA